MKPQAFQRGELRDEHDQIIRAGTYGKKTPFVSSENNAILDYIMNNFDALYAQIPNGRTYVKSVNNITPDNNGNVTINLGSGGGGGTGGTNITVDSTLSGESTNPVQNKVIYAALNNKLDKNGTATYATCDGSGNIISNTYARKSDLSGYVKSINNVKPDSAGNVNISTGDGGSNITVDIALDSTSSNAIANKAVYAALNNKLDKTGTAAAATKATQDSYGNVIVNTYARKSDLSSYVKTINNQEPDANGNINISTGGTNVTPDLTPYMKKTADSNLMMGIYKLIFGRTVISDDTRNTVPMFTIDATGGRGVNIKGPDVLVNGISIATKTDLSGKLDKTGTATAAIKATQDGDGNVIATTYIKTVNNVKPDSAGNINISTGGSGSNITVDEELSSTSTNPVQNKAIYSALLDKVGIDEIFNGFALRSPTAPITWMQGSQKLGSLTASNYTGTALRATQDSDGNIITSTYAKKSDISGVVKSVNGVQPDSNGNVAINVSGGGGVSTSESNTWTAQQDFQYLGVAFERYNSANISGASVTPNTSMAVYVASGAFTINMATIASRLSYNQATVFSAYITSDADYALTISGAGTVKYIGSASDLAITSAGLLLNILMSKDGTGNLISIIQANKLA